VRLAVLGGGDRIARRHSVQFGQQEDRRLFPGQPQIARAQPPLCRERGPVDRARRFQQPFVVHRNHPQPLRARGQRWHGRARRALKQDHLLKLLKAALQQRAVRPVGERQCADFASPCGAQARGQT